MQPYCYVQIRTRVRGFEGSNVPPKLFRFWLLRRKNINMMNEFKKKNHQLKCLRNPSPEFIFRI